MEYSADRQAIISASEDGTVFVQSLKEISNGIDMNLNLALLGSTGGEQTGKPKKKNQLVNKCKVHINMNSLSLVYR